MPSPARRRSQGRWPTCRLRRCRTSCTSASALPGLAAGGSLVALTRSLGSPFVRLLTAAVPRYNEINEATLSGAIDIIAVRQPDGSLKSTPFHVRFGRLQVVKPRDKVVTVRVNGVEVALKMKLGRSGEAYFVHEADVSDEGDLDSDLAVSPIMSPVRAASVLAAFRARVRSAQQKDVRHAAVQHMSVSSALTYA